MKYQESKRIILKGHPKYNEKWLQNIIEQNPKILGLGNLTLLERERKQSKGGRIDFFFQNDDTNTLYEVEVQLGKTDESHIIRTIEYWDIENRKNPNYPHRAVIVAEDITNRFFNVISLLNKAIPIIALQVSAIQVGDVVTLNFTKVLDVWEAPDDEIDLHREKGRPEYLNNNEYAQSLEIITKILELIKERALIIRETYNKGHIAIGTDIRNFLWFHLRKSAKILFDFIIQDENSENAKSLLEEIGITPSMREHSSNYIHFRTSLKLSQVLNYGEILIKIIEIGYKDSS